MRKILFDTEREEARAVTEQQLRHHQQRMMMGAVPPNVVGTVLPTMASIGAAAVHPGMMAYAPGAMAPMMFVNPAMFMQPPQHLQHSGAKTNSAGATAVQSTMQPMMMMDQYQQAAMFQFMANPVMMNPFMQFQSPALQSPQSMSAMQLANGSASNSLAAATSQAENPDNGGTNETSNAESQSLQEAKRDFSGSETNSVSDQAALNNTSIVEDSQATDSYGEEHITAI
jgi:hypothetical protein